MKNQTNQMRTKAKRLVIVAPTPQKQVQYPVFGDLKSKQGQPIEGKGKKQNTLQYISEEKQGGDALHNKVRTVSSLKINSKSFKKLMSKSCKSGQHVNEKRKLQIEEYLFGILGVEAQTDHKVIKIKEKLIETAVECDLYQFLRLKEYFKVHQHFTKSYKPYLRKYRNKNISEQGEEEITDRFSIVSTVSMQLMPEDSIFHKYWVKIKDLDEQIIRKGKEYIQLQAKITQLDQSFKSKVHLTEQINEDIDKVNKALQLSKQKYKQYMQNSDDKSNDEIQRISKSLQSALNKLFALQDEAKFNELQFTSHNIRHTSGNFKQQFSEMMSTQNTQSTGDSSNLHKVQVFVNHIINTYESYLHPLIRANAQKTAAIDKIIAQIKVCKQYLPKTKQLITDIKQKYANSYAKLQQAMSRKKPKIYFDDQIIESKEDICENSKIIHMKGSKKSNFSKENEVMHVYSQMLSVKTISLKSKKHINIQSVKKLDKEYQNIRRQKRKLTINMHVNENKQKKSPYNQQYNLKNNEKLKGNTNEVKQHLSAMEKLFLLSTMWLD